MDDATRRALRLDRIERALRSGSFDSAIVEAEEMLDRTPDDVEGLVLLGDASLEAGDNEVAAASYEHALRLTQGRSARALQGLAVARFELCDLVECTEVAREALRLEPAAADAHYFLGLALERLGQAAEAAASFAAARQLAPDEYPYPMMLTPSDWERAVSLAVRGLAPELQQFWADIPIVLEQEPSLEELRAASPPISPRIAGLYVGTPPQDDASGAERPEALRLFTAALSRSPSHDDLVRQIAATLEAEALNWLGIPPEDLS